MSEQQADLLELVAAYLQRTGRENNERNRLNAIYGNPTWLKRWPAYKAAAKKKALHAERPKPTTSAQDQALVESWLAEENARRREHNAHLASGQIGLPPLEIGFQNGAINFENALAAAKLAFEQKQQEYDDTLTAAGKARVQYLEAENQRANRILHQPMNQDDPIYVKYAVRLTPITEQQIDDYSKWPVADLQRGIDHVKYQAGLDINLNGALTAHEWACITRFIQSNGLDPMGQENWETAALILTELSVIRRKDLGPVTVDIEPPKLPEAVERPVAESRPQGRAAEEHQRELDMLADIKQSMGSYLDEVNALQAEPVSPAVLFHAYDSMLKTRQTLTRQSIRKALFYAAIANGKRLDGFDDAEIEAFSTDASAMHQVSAEEYKRQMTLYGNVSLSRVPNKQTELLEQLVKNTTRKS